MAEKIFQHLAEKEGLSVQVKSAGILADEETPISKHAADILQEKGINPDHFSQSVSQSLIDWADLILTMTQNHKFALIQSFPSSVGKVHVLKEYVDQSPETGERPNYDVTDPFGGSKERYEQCAWELEDALHTLISLLQQNEGSHKN
ncbi:low molecular weight protein arginine phosphatase [Microaerobacter geothermalis]|nr:low molecular weight protein arginine phosphatase [Microaerobacter geothermalis]